ncbi:hypothetical protein pb186bvf_011725 [Paramecium bursaria]
MGNFLSEIDGDEFQIIKSLNHPLYGSINIVKPLNSSYPHITDFMQITSTLPENKQYQYMNKFIQLQESFQNDDFPLLSFIQKNIFQFEEQSLELIIKDRQINNQYFLEEEMWYMAKTLLQGYQLYKQLPQIFRKTYLNISNIFFNKNGKLKLSQHIIYLTSQQQEEQDISQVDEKIKQEVGVALIQAGSLITDNKIKELDNQYTQEFQLFVAQLFEKNIPLKYFLNYDSTLKSSRSIRQRNQPSQFYSSDSAYKQLQIIQETTMKQSLRQSQVIQQVYHQPQASKYDQVDHIQSPLHSQSEQRLNTNQKQLDESQIYNQEIIKAQPIQNSLGQSRLYQQMPQDFDAKFWSVLGRAKEQLIISNNISQKLY